jgi:uncharacterized cupredoxin-like copper-binding protein
MQTRSLPLAVILVLAAAGAGCGGGDDDGNAGGTKQDTTAAQSPAPSNALTIRMSEFAFEPKDAEAKAGKVTITAPNDGKVVHELVLLKTDADPADLPTKKGEVEESTSVGEIADVEAGARKKGTFDLKPGKYAMVCALPGHYEGGMYGSLTVK